MGNTMKVRVELTVEIDPEAWTNTYGVEGAKAIREDVKEYVRHAVHAQLQDADVIPESARR